MLDWTGGTKKLLTLLWVFLTVNYIYCDIFTLHHDPTLQQLMTGEAGGMVITEEFLLGFALIMEIPMAMILLSKVLAYRFNRYFNMGAAIITGSIQTTTVLMGGTLHYLFFSGIEIATAMFILFTALKWKQPQSTLARS